MSNTLPTPWESRRHSTKASPNDSVAKKHAMRKKKNKRLPHPKRQPQVREAQIPTYKSHNKPHWASIEEKVTSLVLKKKWKQNQKEGTEVKKPRKKQLQQQQHRTLRIVQQLQTKQQDSQPKKPNTLLLQPRNCQRSIPGCTNPDSSNTSKSDTSPGPC